MEGEAQRIKGRVIARTSPDGRLEIQEFEIQDLRKRDSRFEIFDIVRDSGFKKRSHVGDTEGKIDSEGWRSSGQKHGVDTRSRRPTVCRGLAAPD